MKLKSAFILATPLILAGCAMHLSKEQCLTTNWNQLGYQDGIAGRQRNLEQDVMDCAKYKINVDTKAYRDGNQAGLLKYCTYNRGYSLASQGRQQPEVCQEGNYTSFARGYRSGLSDFCTYQQGYALGSDGKSNPGVCHSSRAFNSGYRKGSYRYCSRPSNGFALGRNGKSYPGACSQSRFPDFYDAYQSGVANHSQMADIQNRLNAVNDKINELIDKHHYHERADGTYRLGSHHQSASAKNSLGELNNLVKLSRRLQNRLYQLKMGKYGDDFSRRHNGTINININN